MPDVPMLAQGKLLAISPKAYQGTRMDIPQNSAESLKPIETRDKIAEIAGIGSNTIAKIKTILMHIIC